MSILLSSTRRRVGEWCFGAAFVALFAAAGRAQLCDTLTTRTAPPGLADKLVRTVQTRTDAPIALPIGGAWLASLRRTTESAVVRRQLLFSAGQPMDSARVDETLRRLRDQRLYADVTLTVVGCAESDSVDLVVTTRDAWTLMPVARVVPPTAVSLGVEDRNFLGTARRIAITNDQTTKGHGGSFGVVDPWLLGTNVIGAVRFSDVAGTRLLRASLRHHEIRDDDPWRADAAFERQRYAESTGPDRPLGDFFIAAHVGHLVGDATRAIVIPYGGVEVDSAEIMAMRRGDDVAPSLHARQFVGVDFGLLQRAARYDTVSWFVPRRGFLDVPLGLEGDVLIAPGTDRAQHAAAMRFDGWLGEVWIPRRGSMIVADGWVSGFVGNVRPNHVDRFTFGAFQEAARGYWAGRASFEQMLQLDSDLRLQSQATIANDASLPAVPRPFRRADRAAYASVERAVHVAPIGRASFVDVGLFGAGSVRWDAPSTAETGFGVLVTGLRLSVISANGNPSLMRVDIGFPAIATGAVVRRPLLSVSVNPLLNTARQRDGRRRQQ